MKRLLVLVGVVSALLTVAPPAYAPHLFPLVPGDPTGDCAAKMKRDPQNAAAMVVSEGFFFIDEASGTSTTTIAVGQRVTWEFLRYCHSVTSVAVPKRAKRFTTYGGKRSAQGPVEGQDQLVKPDGDRSTYTVKFRVPGTYSYQCVHHASVGMTGTVIVKRSAY